MFVSRAGLSPVPGASIFSVPLRLELEGAVILERTMLVETLPVENAEAPRIELRLSVDGLALHSGMLASFLFPTSLRRALSKRHGGKARAALVVDCMGRSELRLGATRDATSFGLVAERDGETIDLDRTSIADFLGAARLASIAASCAAWSDAAD